MLSKKTSKYSQLIGLGFVAALAGAGFYQQAKASGNTSNLTAQGKAAMMIAISIAKNFDLEFGETYDGDSSLTIAANSTQTGSGTAFRSAATFTVSGDGGRRDREPPGA